MTLSPTYSQTIQAYEQALQEVRYWRPELQRDAVAAELQQLAQVTVYSLQHWAEVAATCARTSQPMPWEAGGRLPTFAESVAN